MQNISEIDELIKLISKLPGVGPKSAKRIVLKLINNREELISTTAKLISKSNVIGWFQGRMEFGPRALGARSILADPRSDLMQKNLNLKVKYI